MRPVPASLLRSLARPSAPRLRASPTERIPLPNRLYHPPRTSSFVRALPFLSRAQAVGPAVRYKSTTSDAPTQTATSTTAPESRLDRDEVPAYELTFTCKVCSTRSSHRVSKQGYHKGTVLISCPGCKNRHLISDNMKIFSDKSINVEDILREKGSLVKRGTLSAEGDVEFWDDGSTTPRSSHFHDNTATENDNKQGTLTEPTTSGKAQ